MKDKKVNYEKALKECKNGKVTQELKNLYRFPIRNKVPWVLFPSWARPDCIFENTIHEG